MALAIKMSIYWFYQHCDNIANQASEGSTCVKIIYPNNYKKQKKNEIN